MKYTIKAPRQLNASINLPAFLEYQQPCIGNQCHGGMQVAAPQPERLR